MDAYPDIVFRDGPAGRRPAVLGGPDVWEVIQVFLAEDRDVSATAENLGLRLGLVEAAVAYDADNGEVVDEWIKANRAMMEWIDLMCYCSTWSRSSSMTSIT
jgi:hypothetical protein